MIKEIQLNGFKSFLDRRLDLNTLTILTGLNSSGKSSVIQALLMLEKTYNRENSILLEGHGSADELKNKFIKEEIVLAVEDEKSKGMKVRIPSSGLNADLFIGQDSEFKFPEILYISANRFGPKTSVPIFNDSFKRTRIGQNGENLFQCIELFDGMPLDERLIHENSEGITLKFNIKGWLSVISPNVEFDYQINKTSDSSYSVFNTYRANNVGFGLSYGLPVIVALLVGTLIPNSLVIIENPEAHLHPKGQTEISRLISLCAQVGTQVIIETHSDHIFDGIRIEAKKTKGFADKVQLHWFTLNKNKNTEVESPILTSDGKLNEWPQGFFDQFEINASKLL